MGDPREILTPPWCGGDPREILTPPGRVVPVGGAVGEPVDILRLGAVLTGQLDLVDDGRHKPEVCLHLY